MATARSAITPSYQAFEPSTRTTGLDQIIAGNPMFAGVGYASQVNDQNAQMNYLDALRQAQGTQGALQHSDQIMKLLDTVIPALAPATKAGTGDAPVAIANQIAGMHLQAPQSLYAASAIGREEGRAAATKDRGAGAESEAKAGFRQLNSDGTLDEANTQPITNYTDPADAARMVAAEKQPGAISVTRNVGDTTIQSKGNSVSDAMSRLDGATSSVTGANGQPVRGNPGTGGTQLSAEQNAKIAQAVKVAQQQGLKALQSTDAKGNVVISFQDAKGAVHGVRSVDKQGNVSTVK